MNWFEPALERLRALPQDADHRLSTFLSPQHPVYIARAPGRLDVMGGIADYSGGRVLELPLECATHALVQLQSQRHCDIATRRGEHWDLFSIDLPLAEPEELSNWFRARESERWAGYVVGVVQAVLARTAAVGGLRIVIDSSVPEGRGVASSAALEVAVAMAVTAAYELELTASDLAALCQRVENDVVGAPCGIMDQMTSVCGKENRLLQLHCQPGTIEGYVEIPHDYRFYGIDSGISHAVSGADYGTVRTAAFMGLRIIAVETGWEGRYLANLSPTEFAQVSRWLPEEMSGAEFLSRYGGISDTATTVISEQRYPVLAATRHPVGEQARVDRFAELIGLLPKQPDLAGEIGSLMYASHQSYGACGLGSAETDRLVELVQAAGSAQGLFGAKITGGGSGGTVAVFGTAEAEDCVRDLASRYAAENEGHAGGAYVFAESGPGAVELGVITEPGIP